MPKSEVDGTLTRGAEVLALFVLRGSQSKMDTKAFIDDVTEVLSVPSPCDVMDAARKVLQVFGPLDMNLAETNSSTTTAVPSKEIH